MAGGFAGYLVKGGSDLQTNVLKCHNRQSASPSNDFSRVNAFHALKSNPSHAEIRLGKSVTVSFVSLRNCVYNVFNCVVHRGALVHSMRFY